jgi:spermidine dehydrogenase
LKEDLERVLAGRGFDFERDVSAILLYRWGHGMIFPKLGWAFAKPVDGKRAPCARHLARNLGRIAIGAQGVEGSPSIESAVSAGWRTAREALAWL